MNKSNNPPKYPTVEEFFSNVLDAAAECGYGWITQGTHHPEDIVTNLVPVMTAYAAGFSDGMSARNN